MAQQLDEVLRFEEAVKDYGSKKIGPISFTVKRGEVVGLLGPNGAGKSTSIRLALGLSKPTSGTILTMGQNPILDHVRALTGVGYSPELPNLQTFLTPDELLGLVGRELGLSSSQSREQTTRLLESVGLLEYRDRRIGKLSKGMVQRLSVAQAMLGSPSLLILDEPMIGIDPAGVVHFRSVFKQFISDGGTIVMSSHIMSEVETLCTSLVIVHSGKVVFRGDISDFIASSLETRVISLEVSLPSAELIEKLRRVAGVVDVSAQGQHLTVRIEKGSDPRDAISTAVVGMKAGLLTMGYSRSEMDEAYMAAIRGPVT